MSTKVLLATISECANDLTWMSQRHVLGGGVASVWAILIICVCDKLSQTCHASTTDMNSVADRQERSKFYP